MLPLNERVPDGYMHDICRGRELERGAAHSEDPPPHTRPRKGSRHKTASAPGPNDAGRRSLYQSASNSFCKTGNGPPFRTNPTANFPVSLITSMVVDRKLPIEPQPAMKKRSKDDRPGKMEEAQGGFIFSNDKCRQ